MTFLHLSRTPDLLHACDQAIREQHMLSIVGQSGSGKTKLLWYYLREHLRTRFPQRSPRIVYSCLWEPHSKTGTKVSTPAACMTFAEITAGLADISRQYDTELIHSTKLWYRKPQSTATDRQFLSLFVFVRDELRRLQIDALIIDNATHLDRTAMQRLVDLRTHYRLNLGIILCATTPEDHGGSEQLKRVITTIVPADDYQGDVLLPYPTQHEVEYQILTFILKHHHLSPKTVDAPTLARIIASFWTETHGNWHQIMRLSRRLGAILAQRPQPLTEQLWEQVIGKKLPPNETASL